MKLNVDFRTKRGLKRSTELELFRRLEKLSSKPAKQINYDGIIDFLRLCQNPAFAKIDKTKHEKWRGSSEQFARNVIGKNWVTNPRRPSLKQINEIYSEIRQNISSSHYLCVVNDGVAKQRDLPEYDRGKLIKNCTVALQGEDYRHRFL